jgi:hypothetical protein
MMMKTESRFRDPSWKRHGDNLPLVREPHRDDRILGLGSNSKKLGGDIRLSDGSRIAMRILYLEEYADGCSVDCILRTIPGLRCYMEDTRATRWIVTPLFWILLELEIADLCKKYRKVRIKLHGSGDFKFEYVCRWIELMEQFPQIEIWGTTSHDPDSKAAEILEVAKALRAAMLRFGPRWITLWSNRVGPSGNTSIIRRADVKAANGRIDPKQIVGGFEYLLCPEQIDRVVLHKPEEQRRKCSKCRACMTIPGLNLALLYHDDWR